jgi:hypothetical protein
MTESKPVSDTPDASMDPRDPTVQTNTDAARDEFYDKEEEHIQKLREAQAKHAQAEQEYIAREQEYTQYVQSQETHDETK